MTRDYPQSMAHNPDRSSYFPAIEKKHGQPMSYWFEVMEGLADRKYPEQIAYLRENHGFSQAHANALVMYSRGSVSARRYDSLEEYLASIDEQQRITTQAILDIITAAHPDVDVVIAWNYPQVKKGKEYVFGVSAAKNHLMIAPWSVEVLEKFRPRLGDFVVNKKTIRIPSDWNVDADLIRDMIDACIETVVSK